MSFQPDLSTPKKFESLGEAQTLIRQQAYDLKLLTNDNQLKTQQIEMLKEKIRELEESTNGYQNQVSVLEENLNYSNQEMRMKSQAEYQQSQKLAKTNKALLRTNQQLQQYIKDLEYRQSISQESLQEILTEVQELRQRSTKAQHSVAESIELLNEKQKELEMSNATIVRSRIENEELKKQITDLDSENNLLQEKLDADERVIARLQNENEELLKRVGEMREKNEKLEHQIDARKNETGEYLNLKEKYMSLKESYEKDGNELSGLKHNYDLLKRKYEDLQHEHESKTLNHQERETQLKIQETKMEGLEKQLEKFRTIVEQKEKEAYNLLKKVSELEQMLRSKESGLDGKIKHIMSLFDSQTIEYVDEPVDANIRALMTRIVTQNRQLVDLNEKLTVSEEEYKYLEKEMAQLAKEKEELAAKYDDLLGEYEKVDEVAQNALKEKEELKVKFDFELEKITHILQENEGHLDETIQAKENDILMLLEEREKMKEMLEAQEVGVRETKARFLALAEEASYQKGRLEKISYVIASLLKVFLNLLVKFRVLGKHKDFLAKYFWKYQALNEKVTERISVQSEQTKDQITFKKFRRAVTAVKIMVRLRRLQKKSRDLNVDEYEVMCSLDNMPEDMRRFICELFKYDKLGIEKGLIRNIETALGSFDGLNENAVVGRIISKAGMLKNPEAGSILSDWSSKGVVRQYLETLENENRNKMERERERERGSIGKIVRKSDYGSAKEKESMADLPRQIGNVKPEPRENKRGSEGGIREADMIREENVLDYRKWSYDNKIEEINEDMDEEDLPMNQRVHRQPLEYRRVDYKSNNQTQEYRLRAMESNRNSLWLNNQEFQHDYRTPGFNSPGEGHLSERKRPSNRKFENAGV